MTTPNAKPKPMRSCASTGPSKKPKPCPCRRSTATWRPPMAAPESLMVEAINRALQQALAADERVVVMGQDVGRLGGVFRATDGLQARFGQKRVFDTPLAESAIVG